MATFRNQATLSYNGSSTTSNVVVGEITQVLSAAKNAPVDRYQTGDQLTFVVSITNVGTAPFTALTVTDDLGTYEFGTETRTPLSFVGGSVALYQNGVLQEDPAVTVTRDPITGAFTTVPGVATLVVTGTV